MGLRSPCISGTGWVGSWRPALEKEEGRRVRKVEVVELNLEQLQGDQEH